MKESFYERMSNQNLGTRVKETNPQDIEESPKSYEVSNTMTKVCEKDYVNSAVYLLFIEFCQIISSCVNDDYT